MNKERLNKLSREALNVILDITESNMDEDKMGEIIATIIEGYILKGYVEGYEDASDKAKSGSTPVPTIPTIPLNPYTPYPFPYPFEPFKPSPDISPVVIMYGCNQTPYFSDMEGVKSGYTHAKSSGCCKTKTRGVMLDYYTPEGKSTIQKGSEVNIILEIPMPDKTKSYWVEYDDGMEVSDGGCSIPDTALVPSNYVSIIR